jgi:hypothetical protein
LSFLAGQLRTHSSYQEVFFRSNLIFSYYRNAAPLVIMNENGSHRLT